MAAIEMSALPATVNTSTYDPVAAIEALEAPSTPRMRSLSDVAVTATLAAPSMCAMNAADAATDAAPVTDASTPRSRKLSEVADIETDRRIELNRDADLRRRGDCCGRATGDGEEVEAQAVEIAKGISTVKAPDNAVQFFEGRLFGKSARSRSASVSSDPTKASMEPVS